MRIWCTVLRKNGTYKSVAVKAGKSEFELDGHKYNVTKYRIGSLGRIKILRSIYAEGCPDPIDFDIDEEMHTAKLKIDSRAIKNVTNKKILDVFNQEEFTKLERLVIVAILAGIAVSAINLVMTFLIFSKLGGMS